MKTTHREIEIIYDEGSNKWLFELRGRDRSAASLAEAKAFIDKPEPKEKPTFERVKVWHWAYSGDPMAVEITSLGEVSRWSASGGLRQVWIQDEKKRRSKVDQTDCYARTELTDAVVESWIKLRKQVETVQSEMQKMKDKLKAVRIE